MAKKKAKKTAKKSAKKVTKKSAKKMKAKSRRKAPKKAAKKTAKKSAKAKSRTKSRSSKPKTVASAATASKVDSAFENPNRPVASFGETSSFGSGTFSSFSYASTPRTESTLSAEEE